MSDLVLDIFGAEIELAAAGFSTSAQISLSSFFSELELVINDAASRRLSESETIRLIEQRIDDGAGEFGRLYDALDSTYTKYGEQAQVAIRSEQTAQREGLPVEELTRPDTPYVWITMGINTCPDCIVRHGWQASYSEIVAAGLPRSGFSVCGNNCMCEIEPLYNLRQKGITLNDVRRPVVQLTRDLKGSSTITGLKIKPIEGIVANKGKAKIDAALDRSGRIGLEQRRFVRQIGRFANNG